MITLKVTERKITGSKAMKHLREGGIVPAVIYGRKEETIPVQVSQIDFRTIYKQAGESTVVSLTGLADDKQVLIHDIDYDPVSGETRHVDFYAIEKDKKVHVSIPLEYVGVAPAVKELGGILVKVLYELEVESLPQDLPTRIYVDISSIVDFDASVLVKDITLPQGVEATADPEEVVALASPAIEEAAYDEAAEGPDMASIEVEKKGKKEEDTESSGEEK
jgi:large subunit ribosomal protein L25